MLWLGEIWAHCMLDWPNLVIWDLQCKVLEAMCHKLWLSKSLMRFTHLIKYDRMFHDTFDIQVVCMLFIEHFCPIDPQVLINMLMVVKLIAVVKLVKRLIPPEEVFCWMWLLCLWASKVVHCGATTKHAVDLLSVAPIKQRECMITDEYIILNNQSPMWCKWFKANFWFTKKQHLKNGQKVAHVTAVAKLWAEAWDDNAFNRDVVLVNKNNIAVCCCYSETLRIDQSITLEPRIPFQREALVV